jgi:hypothetical protein
VCWPKSSRQVFPILAAISCVGQHCSFLQREASRVLFRRLRFLLAGPEGSASPFSRHTSIVNDEAGQAAAAAAAAAAAEWDRLLARPQVSPVSLRIAHANPLIRCKDVGPHRFALLRRVLHTLIMSTPTFRELVVPVEDAGDSLVLDFLLEDSCLASWPAASLARIQLGIALDRQHGHGLLDHRWSALHALLDPARAHLILESTWVSGTWDLSSVVHLTLEVPILNPNFELVWAPNLCTLSLVVDCRDVHYSDPTLTAGLVDEFVQALAFFLSVYRGRRVQVTFSEEPGLPRLGPPPPDRWGRQSDARAHRAAAALLSLLVQEWERWLLESQTAGSEHRWIMHQFHYDPYSPVSLLPSSHRGDSL